MAYDQRTGAAALYRLDPDGSTRVILDGVTVSNGLEWSPDGSLAYYNDTATHQVSVFDYDADAGLTGRRVLVDVDGRPDGLTVDAAGGIWVALSDRGIVQRYTPAAQLDEVIVVPTPKTTACTFGVPAWPRCSSPRRGRTSSLAATPWPARCSGRCPG